jgi:hypothetical protein
MLHLNRPILHLNRPTYTYIHSHIHTINYSVNVPYYSVTSVGAARTFILQTVSCNADGEFVSTVLDQPILQPTAFVCGPSPKQVFCASCYRYVTYGHVTCLLVYVQIQATRLRLVLQVRDV